MKDLRNKHQAQIAKLTLELAGNTSKIRIKKKTISNLFRYSGREVASEKLVDLSEFNKPLYLDSKNKTLEVQGLCTMESIVDYCLPLGFLPLVTPELKHITIGGVTVGIGIESNCHKHGFVHNMLLEADVLLADGRVVACSPVGEYADLFAGLANSYGTLGYILRAKIRLHRAQPFVELTTTEHSNTRDLISKLKLASKDTTIEYIESLVYSKTKQYITCSKPTPIANNLKSIYGKTMFYKLVSKPGKFCLPTKQYIFRYDPEWFWNVPQTWPYMLYRRVAPRSLRNSSFFTRYNAYKARKSGAAEGELADSAMEKFIQDWEVPFARGQELVDFALENVDMQWRPWLIVLIKTPEQAQNYPLTKNTLYLNLGAYSFAKKAKGKEDYYNTKIMDSKCFALGGIKMLYSSTFISKLEFDKLYNQRQYYFLKKKYDSRKLLPTLYEKTVGAK